jgi:hypothetical protein
MPTTVVLTGAGGGGRATAVAAVLAGWGAVQLAVPGRVLAGLAPHRPRPPEWVVRVLGGRMLAQYVVVAMAPTRPAVTASAAVDGLHAATMLLLAAAQPASRRAALASAGIAAGAAAAGLLSAPRRPAG